MGLYVYNSVSVKAFRTLLPSFSLILFVLALTCLGLSHAYALDVKLQWDSTPDADHYEVYWGTSSGDYTDFVTTTSTSRNLTVPEDTYYFAVRAVGYKGLKSGYSREVCIIPPSDVPAPYDMGWGITTGVAAGFKIFYHSDHETTPTLGSPDLIDGFVDAYIPIGETLNLQPAGKIFKDPDDPDDHRPPVTVFIPCPGFLDPSHLAVALYDDQLHAWTLAWDGTGSIQSAAQDWLAAEPIPHNYDQANDTPATIEIQLYHFSGAQAALEFSSLLSGKEGAGGCFISAAESD